MKIGFDAKRAFLNFSGLGNYSRSVIESLCEYYPHENYFLFTSKTDAHPFNDFVKRKNLPVIQPTFLKKIWRSYIQVNDWNKNQLDIFHGLSNELPSGLSRTKTKTIVTIHDVIFKKHPEFYPVVDRMIYNWKTNHACKHADVIVAISQQTKNELIKYYRVKEEKIKVVPLALPSHIRTNITSEKKQEVKNKFNLPAQFLLYVGTIEKRKNLLTVIKALHHSDKNIPPLFVIGRVTSYFQEIKKYINANLLTSKIIFLHDVSNEDLNVIYSLAHIFIYTSLAEGFGIPLIEAATHGIPSITSKDSCMQEAADDGALYVAPESVEETSNAIEQLLKDSSLHQKLSGEAKKHSAKFSSENLANHLMNIYKELNG